MAATPDGTFSDDAFDRARLRWEAQREIDALEAKLKELRDEYDTTRRGLEREIGRIESEAWSFDFHEAMYEAGARDEYWSLRRGGFGSFEEVALATDADLLAVKGIGPVRLSVIRDVLEAHAC